MIEDIDCVDMVKQAQIVCYITVRSTFYVTQYTVFP